MEKPWRERAALTHIRTAIILSPPQTSLVADEHTCDICGASFDSEEELQEHAREAHDEES